jgi:hypothetical protein
MGVRWQNVISSLGRSSAQTPAPTDVEDQYWTYFGFIVVAALLMRLACYTGLIASDDVGYSHFAQLIAQLHYKPELHHYALRYGLIIPLGALYALFGVREWTTVLLPILASAASVPAVMLIADKLLGRRVALLTGLLVATFPLALRYATILFPEPIAEFYGLVAILIYVVLGNQEPGAGRAYMRHLRWSRLSYQRADLVYRASLNDRCPGDAQVACLSRNLSGDCDDGGD